MQGDYAFEKDVLAKTPCEIHTFDCTFNGTDQGPLHHYHNWCLGKFSSSTMPKMAIFKSYRRIVADLNHTGMRIDVLKIDIEGHEFQAMAGLREFTPNLPKQVIIKANDLFDES